MFQIDFKGFDLIRSRDCVIFVKGDAHTVAVDPTMLAGGWVGGQGVQWVSSSVDEPTVTYSSGLYGGFMIWGSNETADQYNAMTGQFLTYQYGVMMSGRAIISTVAYEQYTYGSRVAHASNPANPLIPIVYKPADILYLSLRGFWTNQDELTLTGDPRAPAFFTGFVCQLPKAVNQYRLGVQTSM